MIEVRFLKECAARCKVFFDMTGVRFLEILQKLLYIVFDKGECE